MTYTLINLLTNDEVLIGDTLTVLDGEEYILIGTTEPYGKVDVLSLEGWEQTFYPSVFGLMWEWT